MGLCRHLQTEGFCSLCEQQIGSHDTDGFGGIVSPQVGGLTNGASRSRPTNTYTTPPYIPEPQRGTTEFPPEETNANKTAMEYELATMSGCILALSEHTSAQRHRILHTISAFFED